MAVQAPYAEQHQSLKALVKTWDDRFRWQRTAAWFARCLMPGLMVGIVMGVLSRTRPLLTNPQVGLIGLLGMIIGVSILWAWVWLLPYRPLKSARRFDIQFGLKERVSTALELTEGRIRANDEITPRQLDDAYAQASTIDARARLPIRGDWREWLVVGLLLLALLLLVLLPNRKAESLNRNTAARQAIAAAAADVRDAIEEVATDTTLQEADRESLLERLQTSLETLEDEDISEEEALATLNDVEELLNREANELNERAQQQQQALERAAEALGEPETTAQNPPQQQAAEQQSAGEQAQQSLADLLQELEQMTPEAAESAAQQLEQAANALEETAPEAAESLREAAEAMRRGDMEAAREALEEAARQMQQAAQSQQQNQQSSQQMQDMAQQMQQQQQAIGLSQQPQEQGQQGESMEGMPQQGQGESEQQGGQGDSSGQQGQPQNAQQGQPEGNQSGQQPPNNQGEGEGQQGSAQNPGSTSSNQIGDQPGSQTGDTSGFEETGEEPEGGGSPGGEGVFEEVFAPRAPQVPPGSEEMILQPEAGDAPLREGDFSENPSGAVTVPYNQVFSDYANSANQALDQDYIPLGLRDVVREYFTSLAPRSSRSGE